MDYNALKVADLKALIKERGITATGLSRKQQYIEALESHDASADGETAEQADIGHEQLVDQSTGAVGAAADSVDRAGSDGGGGNVHAPGHLAHDNSSDSSVEAINDQTQVSEATGDQEQLEQPHTSDILRSEAPTAEPSSTKPTVLESNQPVSTDPSTLVTPRQTSPAAEATSSDRKRKRRSPTPPIDEETVSKKLKAAEDNVVTLPEDRETEEIDAQTDVEQPTRHEHDVDMEDDQVKSQLALTATQTDGAAAERESHSGNPPDVQRSVHPPRRAIYIRNLVRPIQLPQFREHLTHLATPPDVATSDDVVETLHLGSIRTHAFAVFNSVPAASRARSALHDCIWPDEPARRPLWVDFVPEEKVPDWIERENEGGGRRDTRRWEVVYDETDDGIVARHEEVTSGTSGAPQPDRRTSTMSIPGKGQGMPNAPLRPRSSRPSTSLHQPQFPAPPQQTLPTPTPNPTSSPSFAFLDTRFPSTTTKPKLYFQPVSGDLADRRLDALERETSREWGARGGEGGRMAGRENEQRRYTFEDGDRIVDGGPHYGDFSGPRGGGGGFGGRGGGRGRGGFGGGRGRW